MRALGYLEQIGQVFRNTKKMCSTWFQFINNEKSLISSMHVEERLKLQVFPIFCDLIIAHSRMTKVYDGETRIGHKDVPRTKITMQYTGTMYFLQRCKYGLPVQNM
jgi:hypothetical protein